ncbi:glycosyltransferase family 4 protein [Metabacillus endolithicus]|uniref:Glycosyltransferase family 4 protein n=1 Tax=Metabacillus endolithicus TaxID=1535204 RepID=A0ABW5BUW2_9BACI|nr:glycosyltransferase family 4 protein [Metabacillus endolithicus]UPG64555.1 glycosyltransferase family 4 protein [Metabacillus endolithicus]
MMKSDRTILILTPEFEEHLVGGLGRHVNDFVEEGIKHNLTFIILTPSKSNKESYLKKENIHIFHLLPWKQNSSDLFDFIRNINFRFSQFVLQELHIPFDLIHVHDWMFSASSCQIKEELHKPLITTIHSTEHERKQFNNGKELPKITKYEEQLIEASDQLIVCSSYMKNIIENRAVKQEIQIEVIPNGVIVENYQKMLESSQALQKFSFIDSSFLFAMGRLVKEKGFHLLLEAFSIIHKEYSELNLVIAGEGPYEEHLKQMATILEIKSNVFFTGFVKDEERNTLLSNCQALIVPSLYEPFGIVALEGMVLHKPIISFQVGGLEEVLLHDRGMLTAQINSKSLAETILFILSHPKQADEIAHTGYFAIIKEYQWSILIKKLISIYKKPEFLQYL